MARREADFPEMPDADRPAKARKLSRVVKRPDGQQYDKPLDEKYLMAQRYGWDIVDEYAARAQVRRCPGGVHPRKVALAGHEIAQASYAMTLAPPNVVPTAHSSSHVVVPAALTNSEHPLCVPS